MFYRRIFYNIIKKITDLFSTYNNNMFYRCIFYIIIICFTNLFSI